MPATHATAIKPDQFTSFGELLKFLRRRAGLSQSELSIAVGYSTSQISRLEQNQRAPDESALAARFVPALHIEKEPDWVARLLKLGAATHADGTPGEPAPAARASPNNLPVQLTSFIGRERESPEVQALLTPRRTPPAPISQLGGPGRHGAVGEVRLLTLTGAGGCGKTRLALQVAAALAEQAQLYPDGVWLIELAPLAEAGLVAQVVASVLDVREQPGRQLTDTLSDALRSRQVLLVLDNCEHLIKACAALVLALLRACPNLRVLATSREALGVAGEVTWLVPALSLPNPEQLSAGGADGVAAIRGAEAGRLFLERALAAQRTFGLTPRNAPAVAQVCERLEGIPLAIELAAARVRTMPVEQIAAHLDDRFRLLTVGSRTSLPHHQTITALIDWSYNLLSEAERVLLRRLAVFRGGWTLEAAEAVCADDERRTTQDEAGANSSPEGVPRNGPSSVELDVLDLLTHLVDKSLVAVEEQFGEARYSILETIRQYAHDKLVVSGEAERVRASHSSYFLQLAEAVEPKLHTADPVLWLNRLEAEHDNFRAALRSSVENQALNAQAGLRLAGWLGQFWLMHSHLGEGRGWLEGELARAGRADAAGQSDWARARAKALWALGNLAFFQGDYAASRVSSEESVTIFRELADKVGLGASLFILGLAAEFQGDAAAAHNALVESVLVSRDGQADWALGRSLSGLGVAAYSQGDYAAAQAAFEESVARLSETGDRWQLSVAITGLGRLASRQGDHALARSRHEAALALRREINDQFLVAHSLNYLGAVARHVGDYRRAAALHRESLELCQKIGNRHGLALSLAAFGGLSLVEGQPARASRLLGAAEGVLAGIGAAMVLGDPTGFEEDVAAAREQLGEPAFAAAWAEGQAMTLEQAIAYA